MIITIIIKLILFNQWNNDNEDNINDDNYNNDNKQGNFV